MSKKNKRRLFRHRSGKPVQTKTVRRIPTPDGMFIGVMAALSACLSGREYRKENDGISFALSGTEDRCFIYDRPRRLDGVGLEFGYILRKTSDGKHIRKILDEECAMVMYFRFAENIVGKLSGHDVNTNNRQKAVI